MTYEDYMASSLHWRRLRKEALERDGHRCCLCNSSEDLEVHHRYYPSNNQWELDCLDALYTLCAA